MKAVALSRRRCLHLMSAASAIATTSIALAATSPTATDAEAQRAHAAGTCGSMGPGSGLRNGKGWIVSMIPGKHDFRVRGGGDVYLTAARFRSTMDFDVGRPYYIVIENARPDAVLEWRSIGSNWAPVAKFFLYPPSN